MQKPVLPIFRSHREICRPVSETKFLDDFWGPLSLPTPFFVIIADWLANQGAERGPGLHDECHDADRSGSQLCQRGLFSEQKRTVSSLKAGDMFLDPAAQKFRPDLPRVVKLFFSYSPPLDSSPHHYRPPSQGVKFRVVFRSISSRFRVDCLSRLKIDSKTTRN